MDTFGEWLQQQREHRRLTREEFANRVGCSVAMLRKIEYGERRPSTQIAELIATVLGFLPSEHETFSRVARGELGTNRLPPISDMDQNPHNIYAHSATTKRNDLPVFPTPLIGRLQELEEIGQLLNNPECRLLTLVGPGGIGKTRLAIEAAFQSQDLFLEGVTFIPCAPISSFNFLVSHMANSIGFSFKSQTRIALKAQLFNYLADKNMLLLIDNIEHLLIENEIELFSELLGAAPMVKLLFTSREPLNMQAEWVFEVQGLPVPRDLGPDINIQGTSIELFIQRARRANAIFNFEQKDLPAVMKICELVDGIPLGIELAAAWVRTLTCQEIAHEIESDLDILQTAPRDLPDRHRSMRAVFDHSWSLLTDDEQSILCQLSIFCCGFKREWAELIAGATLPALSALVAKSLVRRTIVGRYEIHEVVRQYARKHLIRSGLFEKISDRHFLIFLRLAEEPLLDPIRSEQIGWLNDIDEDIGNLRAALEWSLRFEGTATDKVSNPVMIQTSQEALRLASLLYPYWKMRCLWTEGREWLDRALKQSASLQATLERVNALNAAALLATEQADTRSAFRLAQENLETCQELGDLQKIANAYNTLGIALWKQKQHSEAREHCEKGLILFRQLSNFSGVADSLHWLGHITINQGDYKTAQSYLEESLSISRKMGSKIGVVEAIVDLGLLAYLQEDMEVAQECLEDSLIRYRETNLLPGLVTSLNRLGDLARYFGDFEKAGSLYEEALSLYREKGDMDELPGILHNLGYIAHHRKDHLRATNLFKEGLAIQYKTSNQAGIAECIMGIAAVHSAQGQVNKGAQLFKAAEALRQSAAADLWPANRIEVDLILANLKDALGEEELAALFAQAQSIPLEQIVAEQLEEYY